MRRILTGISLLLLLTIGVANAQDAEAPKAAVVAPADIQWGDPPPVLEEGSSFAVVTGDPSTPGMFVIRLKMPAGYKVAPHWHPTDEHVTVLSGTIGFGLGESFDEAALKELPAGGNVYLPAEVRHYATAVTDATIQITGPGPFVLTYVNPADDPQQRSAGD